MIHNKFKAFSMVEALIALLVLSLVLVLFAPIATKLFTKRNVDGVVYTYDTKISKEKNADSKCFTTEFDNNGKIKLVETDNCSQYKFTVPNGVTKINLTLVAGGGGGGGASGMAYYEFNEGKRLAFRNGYDYYQSGRGNQDNAAIAKEDDNTIVDINGKDFQPKTDKLFKFQNDDGTYTLPNCTRKTDRNQQVLSIYEWQQAIDGWTNPDLFSYENLYTKYIEPRSKVYCSSTNFKENDNTFLRYGSEKDYDNGDSTEYFSTKYIKSLKINYLMAAGQPSRLPGGEIQANSFPHGRYFIGKYKCSEGTDWKCLYYKNNKKTGDGGVSSPAIVNLPVSPIYYKYNGDNLYKNIVNGDNDKKIKIYANHIYNSIAPKENEFSQIHAMIEEKNSQNVLADFVVSRMGSSKSLVQQRLWDQEERKLKKFAISENNIIPQRTGSSGQEVKNNIEAGNIYYGGTGGIIDRAKYGSCGNGTPGYSFTYANSEALYSPSITSDYACFAISLIRLRKGAYASEINTSPDKDDFRSPVGGGGAGGNAVRIIGMNVEPGETYIIRVGSGGAGGINGADYISTSDYDNINALNDSIKKQMSGEDGKSGVSTSIWKLVQNSDGTTQENLIYLVTGGPGGTSAKFKPNADGTLGNYNSGTAARHPAFFIAAATGDYLKNIFKLDTKIATKSDQQKLDGEISFKKINDSGAEETVKIDINDGASLFYLPLNYTFLKTANDKTVQPFYYLNYLNDKTGFYNLNGTSVNYKAEKNLCGLSKANCIGGFDTFSKDPKQLTYQSGPLVNAVYTLADKVYDGFYYRTVFENGDIGYVGGLGGFSGLGTKAGCGGLFKGNYLGITLDNSYALEKTDDKYKNLFVLPVNNNDAYKPNKAPSIGYNVSAYYSNCTMTNNNGQSADFVAPNAKAISLGQAGAGGGGGGYTLNGGGGKGGNGQNGYLMIDWRK